MQIKCNGLLHYALARSLYDHWIESFDCKFVCWPFVRKSNNSIAAVALQIETISTFLMAESNFQMLPKINFPLYLHFDLISVLHLAQMLRKCNRASNHIYIYYWIWCNKRWATAILIWQWLSGSTFGKCVQYSECIIAISKFELCTSFNKMCACLMDIYEIYR